MKHALAILLFIISFTTFGLDLSQFVERDVDLVYDIKIPEQPVINDFSHVVTKGSHASIKVQEGYYLDDALVNRWYRTDFDEDPFDGRIEIMMSGQPSASVTTTLIISCLIGLFLIGKKNKFAFSHTT